MAERRPNPPSPIRTRYLPPSRNQQKVDAVMEALLRMTTIDLAASRQRV